MKKLSLVFLFALLSLGLNAQDNAQAEKINKWIGVFNSAIEAKDWNGMLSQGGKCKAELPEWDLVYYYIGYADVNAKNYDDAIMNLTIFIDKNTTIADDKKDMVKSSYINRANAFSEKKDVKNAIADYDKYLTFSPNDIPVMLNKANVYLNSNDYAGYIKELTAVIALEPTNATYLENRASAYAKSQAWTEAIGDYTKLIALNPSNKDYYNNRAYANYSIKNLESFKLAVADYNKVVELGAATEQTYTALTVINSAIKDYKAEIAAYEKLLELKGGKDIDIIYRRGAAKFNAQDYKGAIVDFDLVIAENPKHLNALKRRATAKTKTGDAKGAQADGKLIRELEGKPAPTAPAPKK
ncbi:MAG: yrrB 2 [Bacteroidetes bacterium]|nr:yrrB 2 [Bacteroidota bacterium]